MLVGVNTSEGSWTIRGEARSCKIIEITSKLSDDSLLKVNDDPISQFTITALEQFP